MKTFSRLLIVVALFWTFSIVFGATNATSSAATNSVRSAATNVLQHFKLEGERWTYKDGAFEMSGILLKPAGKGPFAGVLISHGLGGSAESFGMNKAREMVTWGAVCIAPDYTHSAKFMGPGKPGNEGATKRGPRGSPEQYATFGASAENLRRAKTCLDILRSLPEVDAKRMGAYGHSMGGFVTIGLASGSADVLKAAAITGSGVSPQAGFPAPSVAAAETIRTPFLMLHGSVDTVVRPDQSASLKEVLDRNKVANDRRIFEGEGHPIDQSKRDDVFKAVREWFTRHGVLKP